MEALGRGERYGIWGGMDARERSRVKRRFSEVAKAPAPVALDAAGVALEPGDVAALDAASEAVAS
jgi:hypothetical protein